MPQDGKLTRWVSTVYSQMSTSVRTAPRSRQSHGEGRPDLREHAAIGNVFMGKALREHGGNLPQDCYAMVLDPLMVYSCAYFERGDEDLATAQLKKIDHVLTKIGLEPGQHLLDVDCGWGALVIRAAEKFGARCVGITQSKNQFDWANESIKKANLTDRVEIRLQAYPDVKGTFDRITSLGLFEFDSRGDLLEYFSVLQERLAADGVLVSHGIMSVGQGDGNVRLSGGEFSSPYSLTDDELPDLGHALTAMRAGGLEVSDVNNLRRHCVRTLQLWEENLRATSIAARRYIDDRSLRAWRDHLNEWATAFEHDDATIYEIVGRKVGTPVSALPWPGGAG